MELRKLRPFTKNVFIADKQSTDKHLSQEFYKPSTLHITALPKYYMIWKLTTDMRKAVME